MENFEEPNFKSVFIGGPCDGWELYLESKRATFAPILEMKDDTGRVIARVAAEYRLEKTEPPLEYRFVRSWTMP